MLTRAHQIHLKRAQAEAGISDFDYRGAIETVSGMPGCLSSTDARLTDRHCDLLLAYFEAIHWRAVDGGTLQPSCKENAVFRQRGYWAAKNPKGNTSRDRHAETNLQPQIANLEKELAGLGCGPRYCMAIQNRLPRNEDGSLSLIAYLGALSRTVAAKKKKANHPF